jgi:hypothetical protein
MRDRLAIGIAMLERVRDRLELVGGLAGELRARAPGARLVRVVEDGPKPGEVDRLGQIVELELVSRRNFLGPSRLDAKDVRVAGDMERRVFERRRVARQLFERLAEIALLFLVLSGERALLPDVRPTLPPPVFGAPFSKVKWSPTGSSSIGVG